MGAWGLGHWLVVLMIALIVFGTRRLTGGAKDLASALKEFKKALHEDETPKTSPPPRVGVERGASDEHSPPPHP